MVSEYKVIFEPESEYSIQEQADYIAHRSGLPIIGQRYMDGITKLCKSLAAFPYIGLKRDDLREGLRVINYKGTAIIPYLVNEETKAVHILTVIHSSQDYERVLRQSG